MSVEDSSPSSPAPPASRIGVNAWLVGLLLILIVTLLLQMSGVWDRLLYPTAALPRAVTPRGNLADQEKSQIELFRQASPSVVHITSIVLGRDRVSLDLSEIPQGSGSGFIWDVHGHVVTNFHVVQNALQANNGNRIRVTLADGSSWDAQPVGAEPDKDLAVLRIAAPKPRLRPILIGTSADLQVGQEAFAIGNPFNLDQTLTTGVISGLDRDIQSVTRRTIHGVIQTDAAINPGNSGGPLLDSAGRLIGVNTAIFSPSGVYAGIGFAVPVDTVNRIVPLLIRYGRMERPGLGIRPFEDSTMERLFKRGVLKERGVLVRDVYPNTAAARAGIVPTRRDAQGELKLGDLLVAVNDEPIRTIDDLFTQSEKHGVGAEVTITLLRDGQRQTVSITLQALPSVDQ